VWLDVPEPRAIASNNKSPETVDAGYEILRAVPSDSHLAVETSGTSIGIYANSIPLNVKVTDEAASHCTTTDPPFSKYCGPAHETVEFAGIPRSYIIAFDADADPPDGTINTRTRRPEAVVLHISSACKVAVAPDELLYRISLPVVVGCNCPKRFGVITVGVGILSS
jgi:hypothetical protein